MRLPTFAAGLIIVSLTATLSAQQPSGVAKPPGDEANEQPFLDAAMTCYLRIRGLGEPLPLDFNQLNQVVMSAKVSGAAVTDVSGKPAKPHEESNRDAAEGGAARVTAWTDGESKYTAQCQSLLSRGGQKELELRMRFAVGAVKSDTHVGRFAEAVARRLGEALNDLASQEHRKSIDRKHRLVQTERDLAEQAGAKVEKLRRELRSIAPIDATQAILTETIGQLQRQQQSFEIDLAGMKGRALAIQDHVKQLSERIKRQPDDDEVVRNLERVVKLRATQLQRVTDLRIHRSISEEEKIKAEEQLVLAQVELDRARRETRKAASDQLEKLNFELSQIAISTAEIDAKLKYVMEKLREARKMLDFDVNQAQPLRDRLTVETAAYQAALAECQKREAELMRLDASLQPVTVELGAVEPAGRKRASN